MYLPINFGDDLIPLFFATTISRGNNGEEKSHQNFQRTSTKDNSILLRIEAITAN